MADWVKEWTELIVPDRVRNVPKIVSEKAEITKTKFHAWRVPLRCCTMAECRNAVATSHGMSDAFSTGSQAQ